MAIEIEAKMRVSDFDAVRTALHGRGAARVGLTLETNTFFDTDDRLLLAGDEGLRLRTNRDADGGRETHVITYKGPMQAGRVKSREEVELDVADAAGAAALLQKLRFARVLTFEKRRETWKLDDCKVELDELPHLGTFVEIEGPGEAAVLKVREALGLADQPIIKTSYIAMLTAYLKDRGEDRGDVKFGS